MKTTTTGFMTSINKQKLDELLRQTKETFAKGIISNSSDTPKFGVVDLWNIRKSTRTTASFRRCNQY